MNESGLMVVLVSSRHIGLFERWMFVFIYRQCSNLPYFPERHTGAEDPESHFTQAIPIAARIPIDTPHTTISTRFEVDAYHSAHNGWSLSYPAAVCDN